MNRPTDDAVPFRDVFGHLRPGLSLVRTEHELPDGRYLIAYSGRWEEWPEPDMPVSAPSAEPPILAPLGTDSDHA
jgi:hypothetical protein